ncbi:MAG TPA: flavodoxin family protein [Methanoregulaceae archaeon]|nr:flavodoxin family protein [Methanoregulaceae archaeon]
MGRKIIGLLGSPLEHGNTARLLEQAMQGAEDAGCDVEKIVVPFLDFEPCMEMMFCREHEICQIEDDMTPMYGKFRDADSFIIATPIMTMGIPGKLKGFMDRFQVFFMAKYVRKHSMVDPAVKKHRKAFFIAISGMNLPGVFDGAKMTVHAFLDIIDCAYWDDLLIRDMDTIVDITTRPELLETAYKKGYELGRLLIEGIEPDNVK